MFQVFHNTGLNLKSLKKDYIPPKGKGAVNGISSFLYYRLVPDDLVILDLSEVSTLSSWG